ncbi:molybdopterin-guanine dinucleotide biosynthesis protein B [Oceanobacillus sp. CAU 1775]
MKVIQIVGYKNSGKTTVTNALLNYYSQAGVRVAAFKHHGHGGIPEGLETKDSMKHQQAGAEIAGVTGEGILQFSRSGPWELNEVIPIYQMLGVEILFIEGFKKEDYQKIVLINETLEKQLLHELTNVIAVITDLKIEKKLPVFKRDELLEVCHWLQEKKL